MTDSDPEREDEAPQRSLFARVAVLVLLAAALALFVALGVWQIKRLAWKTDLIARVEARLAAAPVPAPGPERWPLIDIDDEYTRVVVLGRFLHDKETLVVASTELGPGYWVLTPLVQADGSVVIVNRGFVTGERRDPASRAAGQIAGDASVTGLLRLPEDTSWLLRNNDPAADRWYRRVPAEIAKARGLPRVAPFFVDADATPNPGDWPVGGLTRVRFSNTHLVYVVTWFALALLALGGLVHFVRAELGVRQPPA
jgi:surfeit locus 1 family protein